MINIYLEDNPNIETQIQFAQEFVSGSAIRVDKEPVLEPYLVLRPNCYPLWDIPKTHNIFSSYIDLVGTNNKEILYVDFKRSARASLHYFGHKLNCQFGTPCFVYYLDDIEYLKRYFEYLPIRKTEYMSYDRTTMIVRFLKEWVKWNINGRKVRTLEEMAMLYEICAQCPFFEEFEKDEGQCGICGCNIKKSSYALNKLAWQTTHCPHNPNKWL